MISTHVRRIAFVSLVLIGTAAGLAARALPEDGGEERAAGCVPLPVNIQVGAWLRPVVTMLLQKSETFRRQCAIVAAAPHVRVVITAVNPSRPLEARARASITRTAWGRLDVLVEIPILGHYAELLPHEFEHVLEQIAGMDLPALARAGTPGIFRLPDGAYETARARAAGWRRRLKCAATPTRRLRRRPAGSHASRRRSAPGRRARRAIGILFDAESRGGISPAAAAAVSPPWQDHDDKQNL